MYYDYFRLVCRLGSHENERKFDSASNQNIIPWRKERKKERVVIEIGKNAVSSCISDIIIITTDRWMNEWMKERKKEINSSQLLDRCIDPSRITCFLQEGITYVWDELINTLHAVEYVCNLSIEKREKKREISYSSPPPPNTHTHTHTHTHTPSLPVFVWLFILSTSIELISFDVGNFLFGAWIGGSSHTLQKKGPKKKGKKQKINATRWRMKAELTTKSLG